MSEYVHNIDNDSMSEYIYKSGWQSAKIKRKEDS